MALLLLRSAARAGAGAAFLLLLATAAGAAGPPDGTWRTLPPPERISFISFIDPLDQQLTVVDRLQPAMTMWKCPLDSDAGWARAVLPAGPVLGINALFDFRYDPFGHRLLATGLLYDYDANGPIYGPLEVWTFPLLGDRRWAKLDVPGTPPPRRDGAEVALDAAGGRLFLVGGLLDAPYPERDTLLADVWQLDLRGGSPWSEVPVAGPPLPGAVGGVAVYEPTEGRIVLLGARDSLSTEEDDDRRLQAIAVDGDRRWVTLGLTVDGVGDFLRFGELYDFDANRLLGLWSVYNESAPESLLLRRLDLRGDGAMEVVPLQGGTYPSLGYDDEACLDVTHRRIVLAGTGGAAGDADSPGYRADVWLTGLDGPPAWTRPFSSLTSGSVYVQSPVVLDLPGRRLIGLAEDNSRYNPSIFLYDVDRAREWDWTYCVGPGPSMRRTGTHILFDQGGSRLFLFGGAYDGMESGDLWELSFAFSPPRWRRIVDDGPAPRARYGGTFTYDPVRRRAILFGGYGGEALNDTWELDLRSADPVWRELPIRGVAPGARWAHSAAYDSRRDAMVVFGGAVGSELNPARLGDTWILSFADGDAWVPAPIEGAAPLGRSGHAAAYDLVSDRMIVLGGRDRSGARFDHHALELGAPSHWVDFLPQGSATTMAEQLTALYDPAKDRVYTMSGYNNGIITALEWDRDTTPKPEPVAGGFRILGMGPNPTAGDVGIAFEVPKRTDVSTRIYDVRGRVVRNLGTTSYSSGPHLVWWDGRGDGGEPLRDGVYFARITLDGQSISGKIILMD